MEKVTINGQDYVPVKNSTIEHDFWLMGHIRAAGLDQVKIMEGEDPQAFVMRLLAETINSGRVFSLLGGMLIQAGTDPADWTPDLAEATAAALKKVTAPEDKAKIQSAVVELLIGFFESGLSSLMISRKSSKGTEPASSVTAAAQTGETGIT